MLAKLAFLREVRVSCSAATGGYHSRQSNASGTDCTSETIVGLLVDSCGLRPTARREVSREQEVDGGQDGVKIFRAVEDIGPEDELQTTIQGNGEAPEV